MSERQLLTTDEAAELLRVHRDTVYALWHRGAFRRTKVGRLTRWRRAELERYLDRQTRAAAPGG